MRFPDFKELRKDKPYLFFTFCTVIFLAIISLVFGSVFYYASPVLMKTGIINFVFGEKWGDGEYGIFIYLWGTMYLTFVTMCISFPIGIFTAVYLAEFAHPKIRGPMKTSIELLVGIPSVVYGIFGYYVLRFYLRDYVNPFIGATLGQFIPFFAYNPSSGGEGIFLAAIVLSIMIIPTIVSISYDSMRSVSKSFREGSFALGATKWETIKDVVIPVSMPGIVAGATLGITRALGETMAIVMLMGNTYTKPVSILDTGYAMTSVILNSLGENFGNERMNALFGIAVVLFMLEAFFIVLIKVAARGFKNAT